MKIIQDFDDYSLDLLIEAITQKEIPLIFSDRFKGLINKIEHPISDRLLRAENGQETKNSFIDLDDSGLDKISFITSTKAAEVLADLRGINKDSQDIEYTHATYLDVKYDTVRNNAMYSKFRSVTTIGRLINKLFPKEFEAGGKSGQDIQSFTDKFKSARDDKSLDEVEGMDIVTYYNQNNYIDGDDTDGTLGNSCMKYDECEDYIQFYADNKKIVSLIILRDEDEIDKIVGRALVWKLSQPERIFMDRIYTVNPYDEELFKGYAKKNGWLYKYRQNSSDSEYIVDTKDGSNEYMTLRVYSVKQSSTDKYPYMDTLKYFYPNDSMLSTNDDEGGTKWTLQSTEGDYDNDEDDEDDEGMYVDFYGESFPEDDLIYCDMGEDYRLEDDAVYIEFYGQYATEQYIDRNMVECDYFSGYGREQSMREQNDTVEVYGTDEVACKDYASNNLQYSEYYDEYLPEGKGVWSEHHETYLYEDEAVEVYTDESGSDTDWRAEDDNTWWEWEHDGEKYDENVTEEELREYHDLDDEEEEEEEEEVKPIKKPTKTKRKYNKKKES